MKNSLLILLIAIGFSACKTNSDTNNQERNIQLLTDSTTYRNSVLSDTSTTVSSEKTPEAVAEKPTLKPRSNSTASSRPAPTVAPAIPGSTIPEEKNAPSTNQDSAINNTSTANTGTIDNSGTSTSEPQSEKKKGWNKATQGAVIGGAAGAVGGAILSKKKGVGAVIGGVVGAAGGYIIGKNKDKKDKQSQDSAK